jgi:serine/threonine protein kinase
MALSPGDKLGPYEILALIGKGGMGEVYRARDTTLKRDVALKVLPATFLRDPERMARFQREAEVLASLDHPNVGHIYGIVDSADSRGLVLALIEGPTLEDRIAAGPIPLDEAVAIAKQIIEALEYAHDRGVVHRDLKPANVKITPDGVVKVLDFGLAKVLEDEPPPSSLSNSPTLTLGHTRTGVILGTAAYMSPEQAVGRPVDRRSDIFSFGAVLYEMLTGKRAFMGATTPDVLEAVVKSEPDWAALPAGTPGYMRRLLERMLVKDRKQRLQAIGETRIALENPALDSGTGAATSPSRLGWLWPGVAVLAILTALVVSFLHFRETPPAAELIRFQIPAPDKVSFGGYLSVSPDGRRVAFSAAGPGNGIFRVWVRSLDSLEARPLAGTERQNLAMFWSPDSRSIAFGTGDGKLKKVDVSGGPAQTLCDVVGLSGGSWNGDGTIIFGGNGGVSRVSATGGAASPVTAINASRGETTQRFPAFLPDGRHFLYRRQSRSADQDGIYIGSLDARPDQQSAQRLLAADMAVYAPPAGPNAAGTNYGYLLFLHEGTLMAQPFDAARLALAGDAVPIAEHVGPGLAGGYFSASSNGVLAYGIGENGVNFQFTWFDRDGKILGTAGEPGSNAMPALSPDGKQAAFQRGGATGSNADLWIIEFARGVGTRFTFDLAEERSPVWSPDGSRIAFASNRGGQFNLYQKVASGAGNEDLLLQSSDPKFPEDWSRDGRFLLYAVIDPKSKYDLWVLPLMPGSSGERKPIKFLATEFSENQAQFSPDGRSIAYTSDESGAWEVYVRPFTEPGTKDAGGKWMVSKNGGTQARWRRDGRELFYRSPEGKLMVVEVAANASFQPGTPQPLFTMDPGLGNGTLTDTRRYDAAADGKRFLVNALPGASTQTPLTVVQNWQTGLKK